MGVDPKVGPLYPDKSTQGFFWSGDSVALHSWLQFKNLTGSGKVLASQMLASVGVNPNYAYIDSETLFLQPLDSRYGAGDYYLYVFDGCRLKNTVFKLQPSKPTPSFMMDVMRSELFRVNISQTVYNDMAAEYWNNAEKVFGMNTSMTKAEAFYCLTSSNFTTNFTGQPDKTDCKVDPAYLEVYNYLQANANPENGMINRPPRIRDPNSFGNCIKALKTFEPLSLPQIRAGMNVCFGASSWNTGIGVTWSGGFNGLEFSSEYNPTGFTLLPRGLLKAEYLWPMVSFGILRGELMNKTATFP